MADFSPNIRTQLDALEVDAKGFANVRRSNQPPELYDDEALEAAIKKIVAFCQSAMPETMVDTARALRKQIKIGRLPRDIRADYYPRYAHASDLRQGLEDLAEFGQQEGLPGQHDLMRTAQQDPEDSAKLQKTVECLTKTVEELKEKVEEVSQETKKSAATFGAFGFRVPVAEIWDKITKIRKILAHKAYYLPALQKLFQNLSDSTKKLLEAILNAPQPVINALAKPAQALGKLAIAGTQHVMTWIGRLRGKKKRREIKSITEIRTFTGHKHWVNSAIFSTDGTRILTASSDKTAKLWDAATGKEIITLKGHEHWVNSAVFSADGTRILTASSDPSVKIWDAATGKEIITLKGYISWMSSAVFSADGTRILTAIHDTTAKLWDAATGKEIRTFKGHTGYVNSAVFSADGTRILTAGDDGTAKLWDAETGEVTTTLEGHTDSVRSAVFSPDGTRILTASYDQTAKLWDAATGKEVITLTGHTHGVFSAVFSADGTHILTASYDQTAKLWDAATGKELITLEGHTGPVSSAVFSADGSHILTAGHDRTAKLWAVEYAD